MEVKNLKSWEEFLERLKELEKEFRKGNSSPKFLYRGQGMSSYPLETTLERHMQKCISLKEYYHLIFAAKPPIESFTGKNWNIPYPDEFDKLLEDNNETILFTNIFGVCDDSNKTRSYMMYLRHNGFPSPLLDWSSSPYIAAYFAFWDILQNKEDVSIFVYLESKREHEIKFMGNYNPWIYKFDPYVTTDRRHFIQQSQYTICITRKNTNGEWRYAPHEEIVVRNDKNQDVFWKFNIPYSERLKVLKELDKYNVNALSLFGSEERLMETMALREIHLRDREL